MRRTASITILALIGILLASMACAIIMGPASMSLGSLIALPNAWKIFWDVRLPRVIVAVLVGCALAVAGTAMQGLFRNSMADPYIIGTSSGGALGATLSIVFFAGTGRPVFAFIGATVATFTVYTIARQGGKVPVETLLLSGVALSMLLSAFLSFLMYTAGRSLHQIMFWLMGGFWNVSWDDVLIATLIPIGCLAIYFYARDMNIISLGEEDAIHLGVNVERLKQLLLFASAFLAGIAVSIAGAIGFIGLITPHVMRLIVGPDHRILLPAAALAGGILLLWSDTLTRTFAGDMPVGIITSCFGAPFFIYLLRSRMKA
ncbi:MAG: iron chelate uptake ABC transporter family permease subunit [Methanoculleus sp.]|jgi:iron complex transport system permease protein